MKKFFLTLAFCLATVSCFNACAQFNLGKAANAGLKGLQAITLSDDQMAAYCKESIDWMDANNPVAGANDPYTIRLNKLTKGLTNADGIPLNFKVYKVIDVNAFACPDGSVRVFSALMDKMSDDELLGIIGHEIGHVALRHSKKAFKNELMTGAMKDAISATGGKAGALADSNLANLGQSLVGAKYSQKQEKEADDYGYEFLKANGKNPWGMIMSFEKFLEMEGSSSQQSSYFAKMFSSHPETTDRINRLTKRANKDGIARPQ